jgi:hypothetical protein
MGKRWLDIQVSFDYIIIRHFEQIVTGECTDLPINVNLTSNIAIGMRIVLRKTP